MLPWFQALAVDAKTAAKLDLPAESRSGILAALSALGPEEDPTGQVLGKPPWSICVQAATEAPRPTSAQWSLHSAGHSIGRHG